MFVIKGFTTSYPKAVGVEFVLINMKSRWDC